MTSWSVEETSEEQASPWKSRVHNLSILLATSIIETCHAFVLSELDSLKERS